MLNNLNVIIARGQLATARIDLREVEELIGFGAEGDSVEPLSDAIVRLDEALSMICGANEIGPDALVVLCGERLKDLKVLPIVLKTLESKTL
jgi:hypothetical protein